MTPQQKSQIRMMLRQEGWSVIEEYMQFYIRETFLTDSAKKETEFDTVWYLAEAEGGKHHIRSLFKGLEAEADQV